MRMFPADSSVVAEVIPSANYGERRNGRAPDLIVLHYTGMADAESALTRLCKAGTEVSAHYVVLEDGRVVQCVPEALRAWHAGSSAWAGETDINSCSIGIEIVNGGHDFGMPAYPNRQIAAVIALCKGIIVRRGIQKHRVIGHSDIAPDRKKDPGEKFPWQLLSDSGVGHWTQPARITRSETLMLGATGERVRALQQSLGSYGYPVPLNGIYDGPTMEVVAAFQRHFRPARVDGVADESTFATLQSLLASLPGHKTIVPPPSFA